MSRVAKLRALNSFEVTRLVKSDWSLYGYAVKPRGFSTRLFTIVKPEGTDEADVDRFMTAVRDLCDIPAPPKR